jgi:ketosteroid isomerase-like protein
MSQENVEIVRRSIETFARNGLAGLDEVLVELCDPEVEVRSIGRLPDMPSSACGREAVKAWMTDHTQRLTRGSWRRSTSTLASRSWVIFRQISRGRASGAELTNRFAFVYGVRNEKIVYMEGYRTRAQALEAAGLRDG